MAFRDRDESSHGAGGGEGYSLIPVWDGAPQGWRRYRDDVEIWALGTNLEVNYCVAARLVSRLKGAARRVGLRMPRDQLQPGAAVPEILDEDGITVIQGAAPADNMRGINNVLTALEQALGGQYAIRRGETMGDFFESTRYNRRPGERMTDYVARFEEGVQRLEDDGVKFADQNDILGWWFLKKCGLSPERRERVISSLPDDQYAYNDLKTIVIRIFPDLHTTEQRRPAMPPRPQQQQRFQPGRFQRRPPYGGKGGSSGSRGVNATEHEDAYDEGDEQEPEQGYEHDEDEDHEVNEVQVSEIQGFVRDELEALATELEEAEIDLPAEQTAALEEAALQVSQLPEALEVIRDARGRIKGNDGKGKGKGRGKPGGRRPPTPGRGAQYPGGKGRELAERLKQRKLKSTCKACGETGHWAGDQECKAPKSTYVTAVGGDSDSGNDAMAVHQVERQLDEKQVLRNELIRRVKDHLKGVVDTACVISVMGDVWWEAYLEVLTEIGIEHLVEREEIQEKFRFGDGGTLMSYEAFRFPAVVAGMPVMVRACVVKSEKLSLLLGRDFLEAVGASIDVARKKLTVGSGSQPLLDSENRHFALELKPEKFKALSEAYSGKEELPPKLGHPVRPSPPPRGGMGSLVLKVFSIAAAMCCKPVQSSNDSLECQNDMQSGNSARTGGPLAPLGGVGADSFGRRGPGRYVTTELTKGGTTSPTRFADEIVSVDNTNDTWALASVTPAACSYYGACSGCCKTDNLYECKVCGGGACTSCLRGLQCARCYHGVTKHKSEVDRGAEFAVQHQQWRRLRNGTVAQHKAGVRQASALHEHGVRPAYVKKTLETQLNDTLVSTASRAARSTRPRQPGIMVEYCCEHDSLMAQAWRAAGGEAHRLGLPAEDLRLRNYTRKAGDILEGSPHREDGRADVLWGSLPCSPWSGLRNFMKNRTQLALDRAESRHMIKMFTVEVKRALAAGAMAAFEWPVHSHGWKEPQVQELKRLLPFECVFDGCAYDLKDNRTGKYVKKPWKVLTSHQPLQKFLNLRCPQDHDHLQGREFNKTTSRRTGLYTRALCKAAVKGFLRNISDVNYTLVTLKNDSEGESIEKEPQNILASLEPEQRITLQRSVAKMHTNLGHPGNRALARAIRLAGGSKYAIAAALVHHCPTCLKLATPPSTAASSLRNRWKEFGDCLAIDTFELADAKGVSRVFLNMIDMASKYQIVVMTVSRKPTVIWQAMLDSWLLTLGVPNVVMADMGGEFEREVKEELECMGSRIVSSAPYNPTQNAICERHGQTWKAHARALISEFFIEFGNADQIRWLTAAINYAVNSAVGPSGYSSSQWVLGRGIKIPYQLLSQHSNLRLHQRMLDDKDPSFRERIGLLGAARRSVAALEANHKISEAFLAKSRAAATLPAAATYQVGDQVYYWRGLGKHKVKKHWAQRWHGPAVVIGHEQNNLWLAHRNLTIKASARHVRAAEASELIDWKDIFEKAVEPTTSTGRPAWWSPPETGDQMPMDVDDETPQVEAPPPGDHNHEQTYLDMTIDEHARDQPDTEMPQAAEETPYVEPATVVRRRLPKIDWHQKAAEVETPFPQLMLEGPAYPAEPQEQIPALQPELQPERRVRFEDETPQFETADPAVQRQPQDPEPETPYHHENEETPQMPATANTEYHDIGDDIPYQEFDFTENEEQDAFHDGEETQDWYDTPTPGAASSSGGATSSGGGEGSASGTAWATPFRPVSPYNHLDDTPISIRRTLEQRRRPSEIKHDNRTGRGRPGQPEEKTARHTLVLQVCGERGCFLTRAARSKEVDLDTVSGKDIRELLVSMEDEWEKWVAFGAARRCPDDELKRHLANGAKVVGTRWVVTLKQTKKSKYKSRLVVQGCQERSAYIRSDAPTGSVDALMVTLGFMAQKGWTGCSYDAKSAYLQAEGIDRLLLIRMPKRHPTDPGKVFYAQGSIYGTKDAGRAWYKHLKKYFQEQGILESKLERGVYRFYLKGELVMVLHSHVDDLLVARKVDCKEVDKILEEMTRFLHLDKREGEFDYCGVHVKDSEHNIHITQAKAIKAVEVIPITAERKKNPEDTASEEELSHFRSTNGQLQWLAHRSRPDIAFEQNRLAQCTSDLRVKDLIDANKLAEYVKENIEHGLVFRKGAVDIKTATVLAYGDSSFANMPGEKSQAGAVLCLTNKPREVADGNFDKQIPLVWASFRCKRTVRSTLAAEAYSISEAMEHGQFMRHFLEELFSPPDTRLSNIESNAVSRPILVITDSDNLKITVNRDSGTCADKRLRIVVSMLRESVEAKENTTLIWARTEAMVADGLTKKLGSLAILIAFFASKKFVIPPSQRKRQAAISPQVLMSSSQATSLKNTTTSGSSSTLTSSATPWRNTTTSGSSSALASSARPLKNTTTCGSSSARVGVRIALIASCIGSAAATTSTPEEGDYIIIPILFGVLLMMIGAIVYLMWQMRVMKEALVVRHAPEIRRYEPARQVQAQPQRRPETTIESIDEHVMDEVMFGDEQVSIKTHKDSKFMEIDRPGPRSRLRRVVEEKTMPCDFNFKKIEKMLGNQRLANIPVIVKVSERVFRHYDAAGKQISKDEANQKANGVAYYCDPETPEAGRLRRRGAYCSYENARSATGSPQGGGSSASAAPPVPGL